jgi:hypothetical protein
MHNLANSVSGCLGRSVWRLPSLKHVVGGLKHGRDVERVASSTPQNAPGENINMADSSTQHTINDCNDF